MPFGYILTTSEDTQTYSGRNPKSWKIKAKVNADDGWTTLAVVTNDDVLQAANTTDFIFPIDYSAQGAQEQALFRYFLFEVFARLQATKRSS